MAQTSHNRDHCSWLSDESGFWLSGLQMFGCLDPHFIRVLPICRNLVSVFHFFIFSLQIRDTLPYLMSIMQPNLRPVNTHLYSQREKDELHNLVNLHIAFNLNYVQEKNLEGVYFYR